jgi:Mn2+/Fe2+ NRAMP family transporter
MGFSNFIALAIMITAAATLHANNVTDIQTSAQAAQALRPIAGSLAEQYSLLASSAPACCPFPS